MPTDLRTVLTGVAAPEIVFRNTFKLATVLVGVMLAEIERRKDLTVATEFAGVAEETTVLAVDRTKVLAGVALPVTKCPIAFKIVFAGVAALDRPLLIDLPTWITGAGADETVRFVVPPLPAILLGVTVLVGVCTLWGATT